MEKRWNILDHDSNRSELLRQTLKVSPVICDILSQRGINNYQEAKDFFRPDLKLLHSPWLMKDMQLATDRIVLAISKNEKILVFGDYDVDGTTSVACMYQFLVSIYSEDKVDFYIPHRYREGYGVSKMGIDFAASNNNSLIVCLDCGIKSVELIEYASLLNIDFIICDHHLPGKILPKAAAILNPKQSDCNYPYKELCGCGVGFKLITALAETLNLPEENILTYLDLTATAIAADIVPMTGENRILAFYGLAQINTNPSAGIKALIKLSGLQDKLHITNVVFAIAPRVNAAGRMDDAKTAVQLFIEKSPEKALEFAEMLHSHNTDRKEADSSITEEALDIISKDENAATKKSSVVYKEHWHKGVVGIVASRLIESYYRPTVVLTYNDGIATGSARSVTGFNLYEAIYECREYLLAYGGHFAAAGLSMLPENVNAFRDKFEDVVASTIEDHMLVPTLRIDAEITFAEITANFYNIICQMEPFGPENMRPVFVARRVEDTGYSKIVKEAHIRFVLKQQNKTFTGIGFNMAEKFELLKQKEPLDIAFTLDENEWNGNKVLQLKIIDLRLSETAHEKKSAIKN
ncbi:MAG: single-stranded-DNA-specific exonuclease RecJ [Gloeobacteraceae cyanobacterium ES-bin-316]|nr:single-stranded-DNA-specific exonuclease RecJ [Ferruginibacter sp.]